MITVITSARHLKMLVFRSDRVGRIVGTVIILLAQAGFVGAREWRDILPLHSTRSDVERLLGPPSIDRSHVIFYDFETERVSFYLSRGPCTIESSPWNVPSDTVISIWVTPRPNRQRFADLKLDQSKLKKQRDDHVWSIFRYTDEKEGIRYEVDESDGMVTLIEYFPAAKDEHLRCPAGPQDRDEVVGDERMFDRYESLPIKRENERLDRLAARLAKEPAWKGYVIIYEGSDDRIRDLKARACRGLNRLITHQGVNPTNVVAMVIVGGQREKFTVELWVGFAEARGDLPRFQLGVNEAGVSIIKGAEASKKCLRLLKRCRPSRAKTRRALTLSAPVSYGQPGVIPNQADG